MLREVALQTQIISNHREIFNQTNYKIIKIIVVWAIIAFTKNELETFVNRNLTKSK